MNQKQLKLVIDQAIKSGSVQVENEQKLRSEILFCSLTETEQFYFRKVNEANGEWIYSKDLAKERGIKHTHNVAKAFRLVMQKMPNCMETVQENTKKPAKFRTIIKLDLP
jgi:hypothetical protein